VKKATLLMTAGGAFLLLAAVTSANAFDLKPGMWEMTTVSRASGAPPIPESMMANLTPEQRQQIMARMHSAMNNPTPRTYHRCLTRENLNDPLALSKKDEMDNDKCTPTVLSKTSSSESVRVVCTGETPSTVMIKWQASSPKAATGTYDVTAGGGAQVMHAHGDVSAKWMSSDCSKADE
jgi:hypothetical protein